MYTQRSQTCYTPAPRDPLVLWHATYNHSRSSRPWSSWKTLRYQDLNRRHRWAPYFHLPLLDDFLEQVHSRSCLIIWAGTAERFLVYFKTKGPAGFFQFACRPISSVERPAWTAASKRVTLQECIVRSFRTWRILMVSMVSEWCSAAHSAEVKNLIHCKVPEIGGRLVQKELSCVPLWDPVVTIKISLLQYAPPCVEPFLRSKAHGGDNELCSHSLAIHFSLPSHAEKAFLLHDQLTRSDVDCIVKPKDAKIIHRIHHTNSLDASGFETSQTKTSNNPTTSMGIGRASFKVLALLAITDSWSALSRRSSKSGKSIASRAATHFKEVLKAGNTDGPHSLWSRVNAYLRILSICKGCGSNEWIEAHISYLSNALTWTAMVLGAPESRTILFNFVRSSSERSSDWSSKERSLAAAPARLPIASRRAAQRAFSAFSLSSKGVLEGWTGSGFSLLFGAVGLETKALIKASLRSSS